MTWCSVKDTAFNFTLAFQDEVAEIKHKCHPPVCVFSMTMVPTHLTLLACFTGTTGMQAPWPTAGTRQKGRSSSANCTEQCTCDRFIKSPPSPSDGSLYDGFVTIGANGGTYVVALACNMTPCSLLQVN